MKNLAITLLAVSIFLFLKFCHIFARSVSHCFNILAMLIEQRSDACQAISAWVMKRREGDEEVLGLNAPSESRFTHDEILDMAKESYKHFGKIPRLIDLQNFYDISNRQALKIRDAIVKETEAQERASLPCSNLNIFKYTRISPCGVAA